MSAANVEPVRIISAAAALVPTRTYSGVILILLERLLHSTIGAMENRR